MSNLSKPAYVSALLARYGIRLKKRWGQNFLVDENILQKIVATAELQPHDLVLEVGPGIGALTEKLAQAAAHVTSLEIDERLLPVLKETLAANVNIDIIHQDALKVDYRQLCAAGPVKIVANLPYNAATPLLYLWLKEYRSCIKLLVCMVQKEVAQRLAAVPGGKDYGTLSVICQYAAEVELAFEVPRTVFFPRPEVASAVVKIKPKRQTLLSPPVETYFYQIVEAVFAQRRKTILNTLHAAFGRDKAQIAAWGEEAELDLSRRGETLTVEEFARLAEMFYNKTNVVK
ncbi:MAG TPA: 16S rRNA (adenine(1518)-N(6)/adenine(1519)-N(6))-dimethyltransferase [Firmicutes bacterium]|jgi:16S rRNA (adenine1518-N6/adenine1519-N6)-dimethyltransferase|nr:16S rRNA (adenine(1518)-N(6)/adenine(1519)-N(6))-dimethyltransferase RsmA [Bacillota bacterium]HAA37882.1 16S rRNA (adenine(1518)-N(6)/adenine(1519)-N(6))-dimethyltransferase [Bacillota bacterium]